LDGIFNGAPLGGNLGIIVVFNNVDSVQEFRLITTGGKAEYGRNSGPQLEVISKSGANDRHGSVFWFHRNTVFNANTFFNNAAAAATPDGKPLPKPPLIRNQFGGSLGGPILKNRAFYFANVQFTRDAATTSRLRTVLTPEARNGLFRWRTPGSAMINTFDLLANDPRGLGLDPTVRSLLDLVPPPNDFTTGDGLNTAGFRFNNPTRNRHDQWTTKVDWLFYGRHQFSARYGWGRNDVDDAGSGADARFPGQPHGTQNPRDQGASVALVSTLTNDLINEFRYGFQRTNIVFPRPRRRQLGDRPALIPNSFTPPLQETLGSGRVVPTYQFKDNLSHIQGRHTLKFGTDIRM